LDALFKKKSEMILGRRKTRNNLRNNGTPWFTEADQGVYSGTPAQLFFLMP
jgi:hypothetical protein